MWADEKVLALSGNAEEVNTLYDALMKAGTQEFDFNNPDAQDLAEQIFQWPGNPEGAEKNPALWRQQSSSAQYAGWGQSFEIVKKVVVVPWKLWEAMQSFFSKKQPDEVSISRAPDGRLTGLYLKGNGVARDFLKSGILNQLLEAERDAVPVLAEGRPVFDVPELRDSRPRDESE